MDDGVGGELDVLGEQVPLPAARALQHVRSDEETGARHGARGVEREARLVEELGLAQEPYAVAGRYPVGGEVLGVAVAGGRLRAAVEGLVHLAEVVDVQHVVGIEHEVCLVVVVGVLVPDGLQAVIEGIALAHLLVVAAREHDGPGIAGDVGCVVGAVVGHHIHIQQLRRIALPLQACDQLPDDPLLVPGGDQHRVAGVALRLGLGGTVREHPEHVEQLVGIAASERDEHAHVEYVDE